MTIVDQGAKLASDMAKAAAFAEKLPGAQIGNGRGSASPSQSLDGRLILLSALSKAQSKAERIVKDATNDYQHFPYVSAEKMIHECKEWLAEFGLMFRRIQAMYGKAHANSTEQGGATPAPSLMVEMVFELVHVETGYAERYNMSFPATPGTGRPLDRAYAGALTSSLAYMLRDILMLPRADSAAEPDAEDRREPARTAPARDQAPRTVIRTIEADSGVGPGSDVLGMAYVVDVRRRASAKGMDPNKQIFWIIRDHPSMKARMAEFGTDPVNWPSGASDLIESLLDGGTIEAYLKTRVVAKASTSADPIGEVEKALATTCLTRGLQVDKVIEKMKSEGQWPTTQNASLNYSDWCVELARDIRSGQFDVNLFMGADGEETPF